MLARPNRLLSQVLSILDRCSVSAQPVLYRPHGQTRIVLFLGQISSPNFEPCPNRVSIELSRIAFPTIVLPEDDCTDSVLEEPLGLPWSCDSV